MKGQTQQVFIYIMVILVVGGVLLFGYKAIDNIINKSCDVDQATFQNELKQLIEKNTGNGDRSNKEIKAPCGYEEICFLDGNSSEVNQVTLLAQHPLINQEVVAQTGNNVFLVKGDSVKALYGLEYLSVPGNSSADGYACIKAKGGNFYLIFEGIGKGKVKITTGETTGAQPPPGS